jgi:outer membrane protein OmpA-like peptidoglycan-associated protein
MKGSSIFFVSYLILFIFYHPVSAQDQHNYTDHKPEYRKWLDSYILDKIEYTPSSTVFFFRFVCDNVNSGGATFYPPRGEWAWFLKGKDLKKNFEITAVKNVRRDNIIVKRNVTGSEFNSPPNGKTGFTIFSCEVHFPRLPDDMNVADLIEGRGQEFNRRHFNCFNIKLKTWKDDLGSEKDSKKVVEKFEEKYKVKKEEKKPLVKKEKEEPVVEEEEKEEPVVEEEEIEEPVVEEEEIEEPIVEEEEIEEPEEIEIKSAAKKLQTEKDLVCGENIILENIKFHDNSTKFNGMIAANKTMFYIFNYMKEHPKSTLKLYGHSDVFGPEERNMELSKQRVIKLQRWLSMYGIKHHRIEYEWFGPHKPLVPEGDISNRRVEIKLECNE